MGLPLALLIVMASTMPASSTVGTYANPGRAVQIFLEASLQDEIVAWSLSPTGGDVRHAISFDGPPDGSVEGPVGAVLLARQSDLRGTWSIRPVGSPPQDWDHVGLMRPTSWTEGLWVEGDGHQLEAHLLASLSAEGAFALGTDGALKVSPERYSLFAMTTSGAIFSAALTGVTAQPVAAGAGPPWVSSYSTGDQWEGEGLRARVHSTMGTVTLAPRDTLLVPINRASVIVLHVESSGEDPEINLTSPSGLQLAPNWAYTSGWPPGRETHLRSDGWFTDEIGSWRVDTPTRTGDGLDVRLYVFPLPIQQT